MLAHHHREVPPSARVGQDRGALTQRVGENRRHREAEPRDQGLAVQRVSTVQRDGGCTAARTPNIDLLAGRPDDPHQNGHALEVADGLLRHIARILRRGGNFHGQVRGEGDRFRAIHHQPTPGGEIKAHVREQPRLRGREGVDAIRTGDNTKASGEHKGEQRGTKDQGNGGRHFPPCEPAPLPPIRSASRHPGGSPDPLRSSGGHRGRSPPMGQRYSGGWWHVLHSCAQCLTSHVGVRGVPETRAYAHRRQGGHLATRAHHRAPIPRASANSPMDDGRGV